MNTGVYQCDDGGHYYVRTVGNTVWWAGLSNNGDGLAFSNVFRGKFDDKDDTIKGNWVDVPRGGNLGRGGLTLQVLTPFHFKKIDSSGNGFGGNDWTFLKASGAGLKRLRRTGKVKRLK